MINLIVLSCHCNHRLRSENYKEGLQPPTTSGAVSCQEQYPTVERGSVVDTCPVGNQVHGLGPDITWGSLQGIGLRLELGLTGTWVRFG